MFTRRTRIKIIVHVVVQVFLWSAILQTQDTLEKLFATSKLNLNWLLPLLPFAAAALVELRYRDAKQALMSEQTIKKIETTLDEQRGQSFLYLGLGASREVVLWMVGFITLLAALILYELFS